MAKATLTAERARELLDYDPETGVFRWKVSRGRVSAGSIAGCLDGEGYIEIRLDQKKHKAHRLAWLVTHGEWPKLCIDHISCDKSDNRICNLRLATKSQNTANTKKRADNTSGWKGVTLNKRLNLWQAMICSRRNARYIGVFACPTAAHIAYCKAAKEHFGEYARFD